MKRNKLKLILDSTPLIYLTKTSLLDTTLASFEVHISEAVKRETTENTVYPDAVKILDSIEQGSISVHRPKNQSQVAALMRHPEIHRGEAETLALAQELGTSTLIDDSEARALTKIYGIPAHPGTLGVLFLLALTGKLGPEESEAKLDEMVQAGLYLDSRTLIAAKRKLRGYRPP